MVAYPELGPEAVIRLEVEGLPCVVAIDSRGGNLYHIGKQRFNRA
ncbi:MAG TPA: fumarate hydratase C-terminal domain-containing protein [Syntrophothermus lipocalidus]|nr:fumarate hydratase C-terminal domain-containing protein [Syntrophothermus lipocalidus]